ncbi:retrovirus-related pol polyprotein from transposon TNT 1-94 [Tanacetum coccineum]
MEAIRIFLAFATYMNFKVFQMDVKSAFLNGKLKEEVYVKQPPGFESSEFPNYDDKGISICQEKYTRDLLKYEIYYSSSVKTPMVPPKNLGLDLSGKPVNETLYRGTIGSLIYLKGTPSLGLWYPKCLGFDLKGYSDSDYTGCNMDRKSTSGACQLLRGKLVCWSAKNKQSVAMSYAKDEYVAAAGCCENIFWMKS